LLAIGSNGAVFVGDSLYNVDTGPDLAVVRLDGSTDAEDWRFTYTGGAGAETALALARAAPGFNKDPLRA